MSYIGYSHAANHIAPPHIRETLTPDGSATFFDLQNDVVGYHEENVIVVVNNVIQEPYASYTIINNAANQPRRLDFAGVALASTDDLYVIHQGTGTLYNTPAAGSVTKTSMATNMVSHVVDKFVGTDATNGATRTIYALSEEPTNRDAVSVYVNGVYQRSGGSSAENYNVAGSELTFTSALTSTDQIDIHHHTFRSTTTKVADASIGSDQLASGSLTTKGALTVSGLLTTTGNVVIPNAGNIGSVGDTDAIAIASGGDVTLTQNLVVNGNMTVSGTTTTVDTTLTLSDAMVINNAGSDVGLKINSTSTGNIIQLQDGGVDKFVIADGGAITAVGNLGLTGNSTLTGTLTVSSTITSNGDIVVDNNSKVKQKGAFMQSSTHQAFFFGK